MRGIFRPLFAVAAVIAIAGCSDSSTSPSDARTRNVAPAGGPSLDYNGQWRVNEFHTTTITLTDAGGTFQIGGVYTLAVPANAVCALGSSYGPGAWDSPCTTLQPGESIAVTATYGFANGGPVVDFVPNLRFSPATEVRLQTDIFASILVPYRGFFEANPSALRYFGVYYTDNLGRTGSRESVFDKSLATHVNLTTGLVWSRIKHFSGYNVASGLACEPTPSDPNCVEGTPPTIER